MKRTFFILLSVASLLSARADELRIARFDAKRVFDQYQHTKDESAQHSKHDEPPSKLDESLDRYKTQKQRIEELQSSVTAASGDTRERLQLQLETAILRAQNTELQIELQNLRREQELKDKALSKRAQILKEIWATASHFGTERHYHLIVPNDLTADGLFISVITSEHADDITEELLTRLNEQYAANKSK